MTVAPEHLGALAGVATSTLWVVTTILFAAGAKRLGPTTVNSLRIALAVVFLGITQRCLTGAWFPDLQTQQLLYLGISGVVGLAICDQALFTAFLDVGPRTALLVMTTSPLFAVAFGAVFLGEHLGGTALVGIAITLAGIAWVLRERDNGGPAASRPRPGRGILLTVIAAAAQATGAMLAKRGIGHGILDTAEHASPLAATLVRMICGGIGMIPVVLFQLSRRRRHQDPSREARSRRRAGYGFTVAGSVVGPYLGVWMSLIAFDLAPIGIAQTMCSLAPVMILPLIPLVYRERVSARAVLGASVAVAGCAVLFLSGGT